MIKKGYKVLNVDLFSIIRSFPNEGGVQYSQVHSAIPQDRYGPLTVFKTLEGAVHFKNNVAGEGRIFKCYYIPSLQDTVWSPSLTVSLENLEELNFSCVIPGSVDLADEVILGEEL